VLAALAVTASACSNAASPAPDARAADAIPPIDAVVGDAGPDARPTLRLLVINEVAAAGAPRDWFEVVNATAAPLELSDFIFVDVIDDFMKARPLTAGLLAPGARHVEDVSDKLNGFGLGGDEELWVYRAADQVLSDGVDWVEGASPVGGSFARIPDASGPFMTVSPDTRGAPNQ
jgi:hypothetical protein